MKYVSTFVGIFFISALMTGCGEEVSETKPPLVKVEKVNFSKAAQTENYSGTVKGRYETNLSFQVGGKILSRNVQVGDEVQAGQVLMTIDAKDIVEQNRSADAQVAAAQSQLNLAKSNLERYTALFQENAIAESTLDSYKTQYDAAVANYNSAVAAAEQNKNSLGYTNLVANAAGVISTITAEVGQVVSAGQTVVTLIQTNELEVEINVPENKISDIEINQPCTVTFWANNSAVSGRVREISPVADSTSRTFAVKISLQNFSAENLKLGMTSSVEINSPKISNQNETVLPLSAIYQTENQQQVWLVKDNKVSLKNISTTNFENNSVKVRGLSAGDTVVVAGVHKLREGQAVRTE